MSFPERRLSLLAAAPVTNGLGEAAADGDPSWPRYVRTTDISGLFTLDPDKRVTLAPEVARPAMLERGDLLMTAAGSLGTSYLHLSDEPACYAGYLVRFRANPALCDARYIAYWTQSRHHLDQIELGAVRSTIDNFSAGKFRSMRVPTPSVEQQRRIADFLDDQVTRIDAAIAERRQQLALGDARLLAILDREFARARSAVQVRRLLAAPAQYGVVPEWPTSDRADWPRYIRTTDIADDGSLKHDTFQSVDPRDARGYELRPNDVIVSRAGSIGTCLVFEAPQSPAVFAGYLIRLRFRDYLPLLFQHFLSSSSFRAQVAQGAVQSTILNFSAEKYRDLLVPWFEPDEQVLVTETLDVLVQEQRELRQALEHSAALLEERRRALITSAVTGEFDVASAGPRAVAAVTG